MVAFLPALKVAAKVALRTSVMTSPAWWSGLKQRMGTANTRAYGRALSRTLFDDDSDRHPPPPFVGGQCATAYQATYTVTSIRISTGVANNSSNYTSLAFGPAGQQPFGPALSGPTRLITANGSLQIAVDFPNGRWFCNLLGSRDRAISTFDYVVSNFAFYRLDSQPDNCGNPSDVYPPPANINVNVNVNYGDTNQFNVTIPFIFAPVKVDIDGRLIAPVTVELFPGAQFKGEVELFPDFDLNLNFPDFSEPGTPGNPGNPGEPLTPVQPQPDGDVDGETPEGTFLTGLRIELTTIPSGAHTYQGGVYRGVCWVYMGSGSRLSLYNDGQLLLPDQFIYAKEPNHTNWRVRFNYGYNGRVTPYYTEVK